jgi:tetratricopeptide (TPR) repeat protein
MMNNNKSFFILLLVYFILIFDVPHKSYSVDAPVPVFSIQFSSYTNLDIAEKGFNSLTKKLNKENLEQLRLDKIGKYYALRMGVFENIEDVKKLSKSIKSQVSSFIIVKTRFVEDRVVKKYRDPKAMKQVTKRKTAEPPASVETPQEVKSDVPPTAASLEDRSQETVPLKETLTTVSQLFHNRDYASALELVKAEMKQKPMNPELNAWQGMILLKMDQPSDAMAYLENAVKFSPEVPDYHSSLGYGFFLMNKYDQARTEFQKTISLDPVHVDALSGLGLIYGINGEKDKALDIYDRLKELDRDAAANLLRLINR